MIPFYSKRNQVYPCVYSGRGAVEKHFLKIEDWKQEFLLYNALSARLTLPEVLHSEPRLLVTEYCAQPTFLAVLEEQEWTGFRSAPWLALSNWLQRCHTLCKQLPGDGNLRNFLWDEKTGSVIGLDLEGYQTRALTVCGAELIAAILAYDPRDTPVKRHAAAALGTTLNVAPAAIESAVKKLADHREAKSPRPFSGIVLAGGMSRRMGTPKADLLLLGTAFLHRQVAKLQSLGIEDIMLSGAACPELPGTRRIEDQYPNRGPLGGLHACLSAARHTQALVVTVDTPLVPPNALVHLKRAHSTGITVLQHGEKMEPLIAVYDSTVAQAIEPLIREGGAPVLRLLDRVSWRHFHYTGPEELFLNCNTPNDFARLVSLAGNYQAHGLPL